MPLHIRRRGAVYYARGTIRIGQERVPVPEFSLGTSSAETARSIAEAHEARIRARALDDLAGRTQRVTITACIVSYTGRPGGVKAYDIDRCKDFAAAIGEEFTTDIKTAWNTWLSTRGKSMQPGTVARWRAVLQAAINYGHEALDAGPAPKVPSVKQKAGQRLVYLTDAERTKLLASYNRWAAPVMLVLAYQGLRTQEALRLEWRDIDLRKGTLTVRESKSGHGRTVPLHPFVSALLQESCKAEEEKLKRRPTGTVFLSHRGKPYADTRGLGGNPLTKAHLTACKAAGITGFRVHDWRHDWAARLAREGVSMPGLMQLGGWRQMRMVQVYASLQADHLREQLARIA